MLRVGFDQPFRPLAWMEGGQAQGPLIERVRLLLSQAGFQPSFHPYPNEAIEAALAAGDIDLIAFKGILPQRASSLAFSLPILRSGTALFLPLDGRLGPAADMSSMADRLVATPRRGPLAALLTANYPAVRMLLTASYEEALRHVADGEAAAAALNFHVGAYWVRALGLPIGLPAQPFMEVDMAIATRFDLAGQFFPAINAVIMRTAPLHYAHPPVQVV
jgi:polar amino acid transport system substrate-binding protein